MFCFEVWRVFFSRFCIGLLFTAHLRSTANVVSVISALRGGKLLVHAQVDLRGLQDGEGRHRVLSLVFCVQVQKVTTKPVTNFCISHWSCPKSLFSCLILSVLSHTIMLSRLCKHHFLFTSPAKMGNWGCWTGQMQHKWKCRFHSLELQFAIFLTI